MFKPFSNKKKINEAAIISDIQKGGFSARRAMNTLFETYAYMVRQGAKKYNLSEDDALAAYNQSILAVYHAIKAETFRGESAIKTYLYRIFFNQCVNMVRKEANQPPNVSIDAFAYLPDKARDIVQQLIAKDQIQQLQNCLSQLSEKCQQILKMTFEGFSSAEIAQSVNLKNADTVNVQRNRCRKHLFQVVQEVGFL
ncbi:MAG: sigma-70 family RNA polymerase sigma factor [Bacteroidota bacterium]